MQRKTRSLFIISCLYLSAQPAIGNHAVHLSIDGKAYECQPTKDMQNKEKLNKLDPVKRINDNQISFESRIDIACVKSLAGNRSSLPSDTLTKYAEQCRQRQPASSNCQLVYSSPQNECLEVFKELVSTVSHRVNEDKIMKTCQKAAYHCPLSDVK